MVKSFKKNLQNQFEVYWLEVVNKYTFNPSNGNKLSLYSKIKIGSRLEPYLKIIKNVKQRVAVTKMRISSHSLPIYIHVYRCGENITTLSAHYIENILNCCITAIFPLTARALIGQFGIT